MKKNKKSILVLFTVGVLCFLIINPSEERKSPVVVKKAKPQPKIKRAPASIKPEKAAKKPASVPIPPSREVVGEPIMNTATLKKSNKVSEDWKEKYTKNFLRMLPKDQALKDFKIKVKKSLLKVKNNVGRNMEHIVVSYKKPNGYPFSFEALVDSETGAVIQTWNKTRYEFNDTVKLNPAGKRYQE